MTPEQIDSLVAEGESETLEFKSSTGRRREAAKTMCAMLNARGGYVLFGVTPEGKAVGVQTGDRTVENVAAEIQRIEPPVFPGVERVRINDNREVIAVRVSPGPVKPYVYRGAAYRRVGNTTLTLSPDEYNRMLFERMHNEQRWENQPAAGWGIEDLDVDEIRAVAAEAVRRGRLTEPGSREPAELLRGMGLYRNGVLWRAAAVLFGAPDRVEFEMPQCKLRVARFRGTDRMEFSDNRQFYGNAFTLLEKAEAFLRDTLPIAARFERDRFERIDLPLYPPPATREAIANALCHRDYSIGGGSVGVAVYDDRLEVTSTGRLPFGLTPAKLFEPHESLPWNPMIARTFYRRGIIEEWGRGTLKMAEETTAAGLPPLEIEDKGGCVTVRFRHSRPPPPRQSEKYRPEQPLATLHPRSGYSKDGGDEEYLTKQQRAILEILEGSDRALALREIRSELASPTEDWRLSKDLRVLKGRRLAVLTGRGRGARWKPA